MTDAEPLVEWDLERAGELVALCAAALPEETIGVDDVEAVCFGRGLTSTDDLVQVVDTVTIATESGTGAICVTVAGVGEHRSAHVLLVVVHPGRRGRGTGRALVRAAERWAADRGLGELHVGGAVPFSLFTGIDTRWTAAVCLFEALGYVRTGAELDLVCSTTPPRRRSAATDLVVAHVDSDERAAALMEMVDRDWPLWSAEFRRAAEAGTVVVACDREDGRVLGAAAHSVSRFGVVGPVAVDPAAHGRGIGSALMSVVLADLSVAGLRTAEIAWTSTVRFYAKACGATVSRTSLVMTASLGTSVDAS